MLNLTTTTHQPAPRANLLFSEARMPRAFQLVRRRFWILSTLTGLGVACAFGYLNTTASRYTAQATLSLASSDARTGADARSVASAPLDLATIRTSLPKPPIPWPRSI